MSRLQPSTSSLKRDRTTHQETPKQTAFLFFFSVQRVRETIRDKEEE